VDRTVIVRRRSTAGIIALVALAAGVLVLGIWSTHEAGRIFARMEIVEQLKKHGARVHWECHLLRNGELWYVTDVNIDNPAFPDEGLALLRRLSALKCVKLFGQRFTDASLDYVVDVPDLKYVVLQDTAVTDDGLARLKHRRPDLTVMVPKRAGK
jgi:hypothetical protein